MSELQTWVKAILAHPVTKQPTTADSFESIDGVIDARVFLKNTHGYRAWVEGQAEFEDWAEHSLDRVVNYQAEIAYDRPVYEHYRLRGRILDCGGAAGTVREFLPADVEFISTDPWPQAPYANSAARKAAYSCLNQPLTFIAATAEFQPFVADSFDWVHMRSMLDHTQVPDLAMLEAKRVLKKGGRVLIGLYVEGGKTGGITLKQHAKSWIKSGLSMVGIDRWEDHHVWHPTYKDLLKLIGDSGLAVEDTYWQPHWNDSVCYVSARKTV